MEQLLLQWKSEREERWKQLPGGTAARRAGHLPRITVRLVAALVLMLVALTGAARAAGLDLHWLSHPLRSTDPTQVERLGAEFATLQREGRLGLLTELTDRPVPPVVLDPARLRAAIDSPLLLLRLAAAGRPDLTRELVERILGQRELPVLRQLVSNRAVSLTEADRQLLRGAGDAAIVGWLDRERERELERDREKARASPSASAPGGGEIPIAQARLALVSGGFDVAFRITRRPDFQPTAEELARGLASTDLPLRRLWYSLASARLSPEQVEAGLTDPDPHVRTFTLERADVRPTPAQLERACQDADFTVRYRCVQRKDFELTQARFERLLLDPNPNMLGVFRGGRRALSDAQWSPYVDAVLAGGSARLRRALADSPLPLTREQMQRGAQATEPEVRKAYCARRLTLCPASP
ncbi:hypothetical protein [Leptothrix discophora]|uniref:Uncharacterized protein n=1 Tax=Leptothrix discophora TaxID=89 RepID=A0ABT9G0P3_LEPDI|nr:hypothetical protein [Leptothrix discophora]MDP4300055.1 hypothetical protein [Leptothrix discophora]